MSGLLPQGACDCHCHVFGPAARFPYAEPRSYTPDNAPLEAYLALLDRLGFDRGVLVQPSAYGRDNRAMLDALTRVLARLRGVAVGGAELSTATLKQWHAAGVRGLRANEFRRDGKPYYATPPDYSEARPFHDALVAANPQNLVWGTDWPHPRPEGPVPDAARLLKVFLDWTTPEIRQATLVENPSRLYDFLDT